MDIQTKSVVKKIESKHYWHTAQPILQQLMHDYPASLNFEDWKYYWDHDEYRNAILIHMTQEKVRLIQEGKEPKLFEGEDRMLKFKPYLDDAFKVVRILLPEWPGIVGIDRRNSVAWSLAEGLAHNDKILSPREPLWRKLYE